MHGVFDLASSHRIDSLVHTDIYIYIYIYTSFAVILKEVLEWLFI
jgi:hypothetical protein